MKFRKQGISKRSFFIPKDKIVAIALSALLFIARSPNTLGCGDFSLPQPHFEGVSEAGYVSHWEQVGTLDLGDITLPINIGFQTYLPYPSKELGAGWILPLFDANIVQRDDNTFDMVQPDGWLGLFRRDEANPSILHGSGGYIAEIRGNTITVNSSCGSGWKMEFTQGKLTSLGKGGHTLKIIRDALGRGIGVLDDYKPVMSLEQDQKTGLTKSITIGYKRYNLSYDAKPRIEMINGVNAVSGEDQSLHQITFPVQDGGKSERFDFAVTDENLPDLKITSIDGKERMIVWDTSNHIVQDGEWKYTITDLPAPGEYYAAISRENAAGQSEFWHRDVEKGQEVTQGIDGAKIIKTWFISGIASGQIRRIVEIKDNNTTLIQQNIYDEKGRLIRETLRDGTEEKFTYSDNGQYSTQSVYKDGHPSYSLQYKNGLAITEIFSDGRVDYTYDNKRRQEKKFFNGKLQSMRFYAEDNSWTKDVVYDHNTQVPVRVFYNEYTKDGKILLEKISELTGSHSEIRRNYVYDSLGRLAKKIDSQQGTITYLVDAVGNELEKP